MYTGSEGALVMITSVARIRRDCTVDDEEVVDARVTRATHTCHESSEHARLEVSVYIVTAAVGTKITVDHDVKRGGACITRQQDHH